MGCTCIGHERIEDLNSFFTENVKVKDKRSLLSVIAFLSRTAEVQQTLVIRVPGEYYRQSKTMPVTRLHNPTLSNDQTEIFHSH